MEYPPLDEERAGLDFNEAYGLLRTEGQFGDWFW